MRRFLASSRLGVAQLGALVLVLLALLGGGEVRAANWLELNFGLSGPRYEAVVPLCHDPWVASKIAARFGEKERQFWQSNLQIAGIEGVRERAMRPWTYASIPRRFCSGYALISDGTRRPIYYSIGEDTGIIGVTWGVEWCVVGLDRNWAYNPACKAARP
ncbi:MAG TPA: hypothetical protein VNR11_06395 [Xanthobacteraceae bacterium]|nr:hypothetical protein [Xanthobacteraceae bacterium]